MQPRPSGFLDQEHIDHDSEIFSYIQELHAYLWKFVRHFMPGVSGNLRDYVDIALDKGKKAWTQKLNFPNRIIAGEGTYAWRFYIWHEVYHNEKFSHTETRELTVHADNKSIAQSLAEATLSAGYEQHVHDNLDMQITDEHIRRVTYLGEASAEVRFSYSEYP